MTVKLSKQKFQFNSNESTWIHSAKFKMKTSPFCKIEINKNNDKQKDDNVKNVLTKQTPVPNLCPKTLPLKNPKKGNNNIQSNIKALL